MEHFLSLNDESVRCSSWTQLPASCSTFLNTPPNLYTLPSIQPFLFNAPPPLHMLSASLPRASKPPCSHIQFSHPLWDIWERERQWAVDLSSHSRLFVSVRRSLHNPHKSPHRVLCFLVKHSSCLSLPSSSRCSSDSPLICSNTHAALYYQCQLHLIKSGYAQNQIKLLE